MLSKKARPKIIVILGPTASGKTALAITLAKKFSAKGGPASGWKGAEIVSADSRQIYKEMDIGTNKPKKKELRSVRHHLIDIATPDKIITLADWQKKAFRAIDTILKRKHLPFLVGGTGLYISSIIDNYKIPQKKSPPRYDSLLIGIDVSRKKLYDRINSRVSLMIKKGLEKEVELVSKKYSWSLPSMHGIGYREWKQYFEGSITRNEAIQEIRQASRNFAKRQMTWFRGMERKSHAIHWVKNEKKAELVIKKFLE